MPIRRPGISFFNSRFNIHTDVALTGLDLKVPNLVDESDKSQDNRTRFVFYQNGKRLDCGFGRHMVLGTHIGSTASDRCSVVNRDAHLDIIQRSEGEYCSHDHILYLETECNSDTIIECAKKRHTCRDNRG